MKNTPVSTSRRHFVRGGLALAVLPVVIGASSSSVLAQDLPYVDEADPAAKALKYVADVANADPALLKSPDHNCGNCSFYTGAAGAEGGPCALFPGKWVHAAGWCSAYAPKPA